MEIISRKDAKALGLRKYYTGKACKHGHICERNVISKSCVLCVSALTQEKKDKANEYSRKHWSIFKKINPHYDAQRRAINPERKKESSRNFYAKNKDSLREKHREYYQKNKEKAKERVRVRRKRLKLSKQDKQPT